MKPCFCKPGSYLIVISTISQKSTSEKEVMNRSKTTHLSSPSWQVAQCRPNRSQLETHKQSPNQTKYAAFKFALISSGGLLKDWRCCLHNVSVNRFSAQGWSTDAFGTKHTKIAEYTRNEKFIWSLKTLLQMIGWTLPSPSGIERFQAPG